MTSHIYIWTKLPTKKFARQLYKRSPMIAAFSAFYVTHLDENDVQNFFKFLKLF